MRIGRSVYSNQSGVALITILLVVVIATVLGVSMVKDQNASIQRTRNFFEQGQARQYALGGEELSRQILWEDFDKDSEKDTLLEPWAAPDMIFEFEDGEIRIQIEDLQGRLNVNALMSEGSAAQQARARFGNLFAQIGVQPEFVDRINDWIDPDATVRQLGAEDFEYLGLEQPYRTSGQLMVDSSELRSVLDLEYDAYIKLLSFVSALPEVESELNINTARPEVLQSLSHKLSPEAAERLAAVREEQEGFDTVAEFLQTEEVAGLGISNQGLGVQSVFFEAKIIARYQERFSYLTSIIQRDRVDGSTRVIYRNSSKKIMPVVEDKDSNSRDDADV
jgi:general secretion pathway protein K